MWLYTAKKIFMLLVKFNSLKWVKATQFLIFLFLLCVQSFLGSWDSLNHSCKAITAIGQWIFSSMLEINQGSKCGFENEVLHCVLGKVKELLVFSYVWYLRVPVMLRYHCAEEWSLWFGCGWLWIKFIVYVVLFNEQ